MKKSTIKTADHIDTMNEITGALVNRAMNELGVYGHAEKYGEPPDAIHIDDGRAFENASAGVWEGVGETFDMLWQAPDDDPDAEPDEMEIKTELETLADYDEAKEAVADQVLAVLGIATALDEDARRVLAEDYDPDALDGALILAQDKNGARLYRISTADDEDYAVEGSTGTVYAHLDKWEALREWIV